MLSASSHWQSIVSSFFFNENGSVSHSLVRELQFVRQLIYQSPSTFIQQFTQVNHRKSWLFNEFHTTECNACYIVNLFSSQTIIHLKTDNTINALPGIARGNCHTNGIDMEDVVMRLTLVFSFIQLKYCCCHRYSKCLYI